KKLGGLTAALMVATLVASPVLAAKAKKVVKPPPPPMPVYSWTGYYIGANAGGACNNFHRKPRHVYNHLRATRSLGLCRFWRSDRFARPVSDVFRLVLRLYRRRSSWLQPPIRELGLGC